MFLDITMPTYPGCLCNPHCGRLACLWRLKASQPTDIGKTNERKQSKKGVRESKIETYLVEQVEKHGGLCEKFTSPGKRGVPDRIVIWPAYGFARVHFVELKTIGGKLEPIQERDHARRKRLGCRVEVIWTKAQVDEYILRFYEAPF